MEKGRSHIFKLAVYERPEVGTRATVVRREAEVHIDRAVFRQERQDGVSEDRGPKDERGLWLVVAHDVGDSGQAGFFPENWHGGVVEGAVPGEKLNFNFVPILEALRFERRRLVGFMYPDRVMLAAFRDNEHFARRRSNRVGYELVSDRVAREDDCSHFRLGEYYSNFVLSNIDT